MADNSRVQPGNMIGRYACELENAACRPLASSLDIAVRHPATGSENGGIVGIEVIESTAIPFAVGERNTACDDSARCVTIGPSVDGTGDLMSLKPETPNIGMCILELDLETWHRLTIHGVCIVAEKPDILIIMTSDELMHDGRVATARNVGDGFLAGRWRRGSGAVFNN